MLELLRADSLAKVGFVASDVSPYFQTTIRIGNKDMQELTNKAVEIASGVGFFGGARSGAAVLPLELALAQPSLLCSSLAVAPISQTTASQRMVKCWESVVKAQRKK